MEITLEMAKRGWCHEDETKFAGQDFMAKFQPSCFILLHQIATE